MIDSISIKNFRNLDGLRINKLSKVNLITGKNNTGKSTLLEAIAIYITRCNLSLIYEFLKERGENLKKKNNNANMPTIQSISSLFANRVVSYNPSDAIIIEQVNKSDSSFKNISLRFVRYYDEIINQNVGAMSIANPIVIENMKEDTIMVFKVGLEIRLGENKFILSAEDENLFRIVQISGFGEAKGFQYISTRNIDKEINGKLWDNIILTEKEKYVIDALKIIEPGIERLAFIEESAAYRTAVIKLIESKNIFPLKSMGDGINRILTIILALVNAEDGYLLIDELENGLHYSIQEKLWEIIFSLVETLNVQVFATTHSNDCISSFQKVLNKNGKNLDGKLIRLDIIDGKIKHVEYNQEELKIADEQNIEIR